MPIIPQYLAPATMPKNYYETLQAGAQVMQTTIFHLLSLPRFEAYFKTPEDYQAILTLVNNLKPEEVIR